MSIESVDTQVAVVGLGYVGTCLTAILAESGMRVHGIDINKQRIEEVSTGQCPIKERRITDLFEEYAKQGRITATTDYDVLGQCDHILVTVGTPLAEQDPDISAVEAACKSIGDHLRSGQTVIFRSTLPATTTISVVEPILSDRSGLTVGEEYSLAFCPERMAEGSAYADLTSVPVVVGGVTEASQQDVEAFWEALDMDTVSVSNPTAAELAKLADNWWIDLNIAIANEIALLAEKLGVDAMEVIEAANSLPKGQHNVNILYPGAGVGGSCLVKDPWFVANLGEEYGLELETPRVSRRVNDRMPQHMVDLVGQTLDSLDGASVALLGYAFKGNTDDTRNTPAKPIAKGLLDSDVELRITDPYVPASIVESDLGVSPQRLRNAVKGVDAVVIATGHDQYRTLSSTDLIKYVGTESFAVIDGRFMFSPSEFSDTAVEYVGVGRGSNPPIRSGGD